MLEGASIVYTAAGLLVAGGAIWRQAIRPVTKGVGETYDEVKALRKLLEPDDDGRTIPERLTGLEQQMAVIDERSKQLEPNGGKSLYDRVGKLEDGQKRAQRQQATFTKKLTPMVETIAALSGPPKRTAPRIIKEKP